MTDATEPSELGWSTQPRTDLGQKLAAALGSEFDLGSLRQWADGHLLPDLFERGQVAVAWVCVVDAARQRFGNPPDVRAINRWLTDVQERVPACQGMKVQLVEWLIRILLGEYWLEPLLDFRAVFDMDPDWVLVWFLLVREYVEDTGLPPGILVAEAEAKAATGGVPTEVVEGLRRFWMAVRDDPSSRHARHPVGRALRAALGDGG